MNFVVTGGGSGGHIFPAIAVARHLIDGGHRVTYVGARGGMEERLVPEAGIKFHSLPAGKYNRGTLQPSEAIKAAGGLLAARRLLGQLHPDAVLTTGGFAGFPFAFVAELARLPVVLLEQNAVMGLANRWLAPRARRIAMAIDANLPQRYQEKKVVTGMPVREERHSTSEARLKLGLDPQKPLLLVMGGSQGSLALNRLLPDLLKPWLDDWQVLHQTGKVGFEETAAKVASWPGYRVTEFIDAPLAWSAASAAVTRAGATTLAEAAFYRVPLLALPLPASVDGGAQLRNATYYAERGAVLVADQDKPEQVAAALNKLASSPVRESLRASLASLSPEGAAERLAALLQEVAG
ncbi:UDP-N-acetylglucosamine--N-acetylmuramyl-(pentapeptide) pyrophosphoryl-undecaprenol N-acetylglucosamine transferase [Oceanithermus sp.]